MKNLYWLSIAFGLVVSGFFLAGRRFTEVGLLGALICACLLYTSPSPRDS